jgi:hypothetical protein
MRESLTRYRSTLFLVLTVLLELAIATEAEKSHVTVENTEFFIIWGTRGHWNGELTIKPGQFTKVTPYLFTGGNDRIEEIADQKISWSSDTWGGVDGLHIFAEVTPKSSIRFSSNRTTQDFKLKDVPEKGHRIVHLNKQSDFLILGKGSPVKGPRPKSQIPTLDIPALPDAQRIMMLPDDLTKKGNSVYIQLSELPPEKLAVRRRSRNDGLLYLEIYSQSGPLRGLANIGSQGSCLEAAVINGSLWLSLRPRIGKITIVVGSKDHSRTEQFTVPTTLVEVRGNKLFLNAEPFLIKGTLPRNMNDKDARYIKSLGMNTLRGITLDEIAERYGFMIISSLNRDLSKIVTTDKSPTNNMFEMNLETYVGRLVNRARQVVQSPYTLIIQLGNEQAYGSDPWSDSRKTISNFDRLDILLAKAWTSVKPIDPMLPLGYANHALGYIAPDFLDVYMHNSYMDKDRYGIPLEIYMQWQGCEDRPFVNTEFGANRYTPQAYHGAKNTPVLEKIHAWNYYHRWKTYIDAGAVGGTNYCLYDLEEPWDQGTSNFGILTFDRQPKLACWQIWHMWRDFEVTTLKGKDTTSLAISYKRDYWARDCNFKITSEKNDKAINIEDFSPNSQRVVKVPLQLNSFHWQMNYTTHRGLKMVATGACPQSVEEKDFLCSLKERETFPFLRELFDAEVITVGGQIAPSTITDMKRDDGVIPVAFRKRNGTVYVTAFARLDIDKDLYVKADIETAFRGELLQVDEWTGEPTTTSLEWGTGANGIRIMDVSIPRIPGPIGKRSDEPLSIPVFRITPAPVSD